MQVLDLIHDGRINCSSFMTTMTIEEYLEIVDYSYKNNGGIEEQREPLKTKTAKVIRDRMVNDILQGAILPPIVLGLTINNEDINVTKKTLDSFVNENIKSIAIIDGMQRTTAINEALSKSKNKSILNNDIRVEFWIAQSSFEILYRMLVLNTGQIPWGIKKQFEIIYKSFIEELNVSVENMNLITSNDKEKRKNPGDYPAESVIELYLAFSSRDFKINTRQALSNEFVKYDILETSSYKEFKSHFVKSLELMCKLDDVLFKFESLLSAEIPDNNDGYLEDIEEEKKKKYKFVRGRDLFGSQTFRVGFITAISRSIFGLIGTNYTETEIDQRFNTIVSVLESLIEKLEGLNQEELETYLDFEELNKNISEVKTGIGIFEREYFTDSFYKLFKYYDEIDSLTFIWRQ